jgi:CubicO group peptidase (beta-lactamase class C family)
MKNLIAIVIVFIILSTLTFAQVLPTTTPEDVGLSTERLNRIKPLMQKHIDDGTTAGILTMIARQGKIAHLEMVGMRDIANNKPITENTIFRIYSMSKAITSIAVMTLYEEGRFNLDDPVSDYIPEFVNLMVFKDSADTGLLLDSLETPMTIRHLLTHTSGLTYGWEGPAVIDRMYARANIFEAGTTLKDMIRKLSEIPLVFQPGEEWLYSVSVDVLGYLVEVISGMPFETFLQKRLFHPLGMVDTGFSVPENKRDRYSELYYIDEESGDLKVSEEIPLGDGKYNFFPSGGGGLVSTAGDYMRFCQMLLNGGELNGVRILGRRTVELIRSNNLPNGVFVDNDQNIGFGLGFAVVLNMVGAGGMVSNGTYSWGGAASTIFWIDPEEELIGILMTQLFGEAPFHDQFRTLVYSSIID